MYHCVCASFSWKQVFAFYVIFRSISDVRGYHGVFFFVPRTIVLLQLMRIIPIELLLIFCIICKNFSINWIKVSKVQIKGTLRTLISLYHSWFHTLHSKLLSSSSPPVILWLKVREKQSIPAHCDCFGIDARFWPCSLPLQHNSICFLPLITYERFPFKNQFENVTS